MFVHGNVCQFTGEVCWFRNLSFGLHHLHPCLHLQFCFFVSVFMLLCMLPYHTYNQGIISLLRGFEFSSGLKINYAKSQFGIIGGMVNWADEAAQILNCRQLETPFYYLGIPIGAKPSSRLVWEPLIKKNVNLNYPSGHKKIYPWQERSL